MQIPFAPLPGAGVQIATGSYVGDGAYGSDHPTTLRFPFTPKLIVVSGADTSSSSGERFSVVLVKGETFVKWLGGWGGDVRSCYISAISWGDKSVSLQSSSDYEQLNRQGKVYYYFAIG